MLRSVTRVLSVVVALAFLVTGIIGCKPSGSPPESKPSVKPEDSIVRVIQDWPTYIDPAVGNDFSDTMALVNLYDTLVFPNVDGSIRPHLATSWEVSPDGMRYKFEIRKGARFHNGEEVTAEDVAFSMQRLLTIGEGYGYLFTAKVAEAKALDRYTVEFGMKEPYGAFLSALVRFYVLSKKEVLAHLEKPGQYGDMGDYGKKWLLTHDAGSGPYKVKEVKMEEYVLAERFDDWWGWGAGWDIKDTPRFYKEMATPDPVTVRTLMARRELELTDNFQPEENIQALAKIPGVSVVGTLTGSNLNIQLNTKRPPTDDVHFRKALAYCFDYETVVQKLWPGSKLAQGPVPANLPGAHPNLPLYRRNLEKAREELKKSKYYGQLDKYPVQFYWMAEIPDEEKIGLLLQANAAEIGVKVEVTKKPVTAMYAEGQRPETTPNAVTIFVAPDYPEAGSMLKMRYHSSTCGTFAQFEWLQDKEIDRLIEQALATLDREQRFKLYQLIQEKIVDLCPTIWVFDWAEKRAWQSEYVYWPAGEEAKAGRPICPVFGYTIFMPDFKVFPDKRAALLGGK